MSETDFQMCQTIIWASLMRRGGRVAEGARLESVYAGNRIAGSNPAPSAITQIFESLRSYPQECDL